MAIGNSPGRHLSITATFMAIESGKGAVRHIIVDGYNVIRADARLLSLERVSLEHAREVLVRTIASSPRLANDQITVVFDGARGGRRHVHAHRMGRVEVAYSAWGQTADDVIVKQARDLAGARTVVVVSNDREVREQCRAAGCEVSGSENLLSQLPGTPTRQRRLDSEDEEPRGTLSTHKRGNPRRASKRSKRSRDIRF
jgi:predicted RNA-binding protein with PIN domain